MLSFPDLGKRAKFILLSGVLALSFAVTFFLPSGVWLASVFISTAVSAVGVWLFFGRGWGRGSNFLLILPVLFVMSTGFVQYLFPHLSIWFRVVFWLGFGAVFYLLLLVLNILFVAGRRGDLPLIRPAKTALFFAEILTAFFGFSIIFKGVSFLALQSFLVVILSLLLGLVFFSGFELDSSGLRGSLFQGGALITWAAIQSFMALSFVPLKSFSRALCLAVVFYMLLGVAREYVEHRLNKRSIWEYLALLILLGVTVFKLPR